MYGTKTAQDCQDMTAQVRSQISSAVSTGTSSDIASLVNQLAYWEGRTRAHYEAEKVEDPASRLVHLAELLAAPTDDTKSGRLNDVERSYRDGIREATGRLITKAAVAANIES